MSDERKLMLDHFQIETLRGVLRQHWEAAGHSAEATDTLCDMALLALRSPSREEVIEECKAFLRLTADSIKADSGFGDFGKSVLHSAADVLTTLPSLKNRNDNAAGQVRASEAPKEPSGPVPAAPFDDKGSALLSTLEFAVQYRRKDETRWTTMAAFDFEGPAVNYANKCGEDDVPWEYQVVPLNARRT